MSRSSPNRRSRILGPDAITDLLAAYRDGDSIAALARKYDCDRVTIRAVLIRYGVERRTAQQQLALEAERQRREVLERLRRVPRESPPDPQAAPYRLHDYGWYKA